jgi:hypothetical protein
MAPVPGIETINESRKGVEKLEHTGTNPKKSSTKPEAKGDDKANKR